MARFALSADLFFFLYLQSPLVCTNQGNFVFTEHISLHFRSEASFHIHCRYPRSNSPGFPISACAETPGCCSQVPVLCTGKQRCLTVNHIEDKTTIPWEKTLLTSDLLSPVSNLCFSSNVVFFSLRIVLSVTCMHGKQRILSIVWVEQRQ